MANNNFLDERSHHSSRPDHQPPTTNHQPTTNHRHHHRLKNGSLFDRLSRSRSKFPRERSTPTPTFLKLFPPLKNGLGSTQRRFYFFAPEYRREWLHFLRLGKKNIFFCPCSYASGVCSKKKQPSRLIFATSFRLFPILGS